MGTHYYALPLNAVVNYTTHFLYGDIRDRMGLVALPQAANGHAADQSAGVIVLAPPLFVEVPQPHSWAPSRATWQEVNCYKAGDVQHPQHQIPLNFLPGIFLLIPSTVRNGCSVPPFTSPSHHGLRCTVA